MKTVLASSADEAMHPEIGVILVDGFAEFMRIPLKPAAAKRGKRVRVYEMHKTRGHRP